MEARLNYIAEELQRVEASINRNRLEMQRMNPETSLIEKEDLDIYYAHQIYVNALDRHNEASIEAARVVHRQRIQRIRRSLGVTSLCFAAVGALLSLW